MSKFKKSVAQMARELRNALKRNFLSEDGKALAEAIGTVIAEAENSEEEVSAEELNNRIKAAFDALKPEEKDPEKTAEEVAETENFKLAVNRILSENSAGKGTKGSSYLSSANAVKDFARTIHVSASGEEFRENWRAVLTKNGVTGMAYPEQVEAGINTAWANANGLFMALRYVSPREFRIMYSAADTKDQLAHGHKVGASKKEQVIPAQGKKLSLQMIYKWLPVNRLDMQAMEQPDVFVQWVTTELTERLLYTIERTIVAGDPNASVTADAISCFESIGTKTAADAFTLYYGVTPRQPRLRLRIFTRRSLRRVLKSVTTAGTLGSLSTRPTSAHSLRRISMLRACPSVRDSTPSPHALALPRSWLLTTLRAVLPR